MGSNPGYLLKSYLLNLTLLLKNRNSTSEEISTWCVLVVVRDLVRTKAYFVWRPSFAFSTYPTSWQALRSLALRGLHCLTFKPYGVKFSMKSQLNSLKTSFHTFIFFLIFIRHLMESLDWKNDRIQKVFDNIL